MLDSEGGHRLTAEEALGSLGTSSFRDTDPNSSSGSIQSGASTQYQTHRFLHGNRQATHLGILTVTHFSKMQAGNHSKPSCKALEQQSHNGSQQKHPEQLRRTTSANIIRQPEGFLTGCLGMLTGNSSSKQGNGSTLCISSTRDPLGLASF